MTRRTFATMWLAPILGIACSSGSSGNGQVPATTFGSFTQDYCNLLKPCCAQAGLSTNGALCQAFLQALGGQNSYNSATGQACIAGVQAESGSETFCTTTGNDVPACNGVLGAGAAGTTPAGQPCMQDSDCAPAAGGGATCFGQFIYVDGGSAESETCLQTLPGKAGDGPCVGSVLANGTTYSWSGPAALPAQGYLCAVADGLTCDFGTQICVALASVGQPCSDDSQCTSSAYCAFGTATAQCADRLAVGASCAAGPTGCVTTAYCDSSQTCATLLAAGSPCNTSEQCASDECVNQACGTSNSLGLALLCGSN